MATVDLGKISFTQKGTWNSGTAYVSKDVVQYTDDNETSSYVAVASSTNQAPSTNGTVNTSYWALFAKGATVGSTNEGVWDVATAYQKNAVVQYTDSGTVSTFLAVADSTGEIPSTSGTVNSSYWQLIAKGTDSAGLSWQSTIVTGTTLTALAGNGYWIDTTSNSCTVTLPASASVGDTIEFVDYARNWGTNNVTINPNSLNFQGNSSPNPVYDVDGQSVRIVYSGATQGWIPSVDDDVTLETPQTVDAEYLVVAGGGGGGLGNAGGGGAGGYLTNYGGTAITLSAGSTYTVTVGDGGAGKDGSVTGKGSNGADSVLSGTGISTITAIGGGGGGSGSSGLEEGLAGGSGGGGAYNGNGGAGTAPQGNAGGSQSTSAPEYGAGGGGGAGAVGGSGTNSNGGDGGVGLSNSITGAAVFYAGGGGGSNNTSTTANAGSGGNGGGGDGGTGSTQTGTNGTANTGGGGGGSESSNVVTAGDGGSGVVILRIPTGDYSGTTTGSPTVDTDGTDTILTFTGSGSYTA